MIKILFKVKVLAYDMFLSVVLRDVFYFCPRWIRINASSKVYLKFLFLFSYQLLQFSITVLSTNISNGLKHMQLKWNISTGKYWNIISMEPLNEHFAKFVPTEKKGCRTYTIFTVSINQCDPIHQRRKTLTINVSSHNYWYECLLISSNR